jgi:hypothetical protein
VKTLEPIEVIFEGGAAGQLLGLATGLYIKKTTGIPFKLVLIPGAYALTPGYALHEVTAPSEWMIYKKEPAIEQPREKGGRFWRLIPSRYRFIFIPLRVVLEFSIRKYSDLGIHLDNRKSVNLRLRYSGDMKTLNLVNSKTKSIRGNHWAGLVSEVMSELEERFSSFSKFNPFNLSEENIEGVAIHYRLGDMRTNRESRINFGVLDPEQILKFVIRYQKKSQKNLAVTVFSDEPDVAQSLFENLGISEWRYEKNDSVWDDISIMSRYTHFIGSYSSVSGIISEIRSVKRLEPSILPLNSRRYAIKAKQGNVSYFKSKVLPLDHWVYEM